MIFQQPELDELAKEERVKLITSLPGAKPICLVGTISESGVTNLAPFSSITHLGSNPPLIGMVTRPDTVERHTLKNILDQECWTLNHVHSAILPQAHQCSARYSAEQSEFAETGLTESYHPPFTAPFVAESRIKYGLILEDIVDIKANATKLIIGRVTIIELENSLWDKEKGLDLMKANSLASTALDTYFELTNSTSIPYAKP